MSKFKFQGTLTSEEGQDDQYVADLLSVADEKIHKLQIDISKMKDGKEATERRNKSLHKQVCMPLKEIFVNILIHLFSI